MPYLFKQTLFEKEIQDLTAELQTAVALVEDRVNCLRDGQTSPETSPLSPSLLDPVHAILYNNNLRSANYVLLGMRSNAPRHETYEDFEEVAIMVEDIKISSFHHWCRPSAEENQLLPLLQLLDRFLQSLRFFDVKDDGFGGAMSVKNIFPISTPPPPSKDPVGENEEDAEATPGQDTVRYKSENDVAFMLAQALWLSTFLVFSLHFPEGTDSSHVRAALEAVMASFLVGDDANEEECPTMQDLVKMIKIDFTQGWDYMCADILRRHILFPLSDPSDKHALFHKEGPMVSAPKRVVERNFFSILFDYQLISKRTPNEKLAFSSCAANLCDLNPDYKDIFALQVFLKRILFSFEEIISSNSLGMFLVVHGAGFLVQLQQHWQNVLARFNLSQIILDFDYSSESAKLASAAAAEDYQLKLAAYLEGVKELEDYDAEMPPSEANFKLLLASQSRLEALSQVVFCINTLSIFSAEMARTVIHPEGDENHFVNAARNSPHPSIYPPTLRLMPDYDGSTKGEVDMDEISAWTSPDEPFKEPFWFYPEQNQFYGDLFIFQTVTFSKLTLLLYKYLHLDPGSTDWIWHAYSMRDIPTVTASKVERVGVTFFHCVDILLSTVICSGGFTSNRLLFNLLFDEGRPASLPQSQAVSDAELYEKMKELPTVDGGRLQMVPPTTLATDEFDLAIGLLEHQLPDSQILSKTQILSRQSRLLSSDPEFTHSFLDIILQHHISDSTAHQFVPDHEYVTFEDNSAGAPVPISFTFPVPSLLFFVSSIFFGTSSQILFTYERRYQALYRYLLLDQRLGLLMEQLLLTLSDPSVQSLTDDGWLTQTPNWIHPGGGKNYSFFKYSYILCNFGQGMDSGSHVNYDPCGLDAYGSPSQRSWTDCISKDDLPAEISALSKRVCEWRATATQRQDQYCKSEFFSQLCENEPETSHRPVFNHKFIKGYAIQHLEQLSGAYKAHYQMQMDLFHNTNFWHILSFSLQQQYHVRNIFLVKSRLVNEVFRQCKLTGIPIPKEDENLGNAIWYNPEHVLPDALQEGYDNANDDEDAEPPAEYVFTGLPKTQLYNWLYFKGQFFHPRDLVHTQGTHDIVVTGGFLSEEVKGASFESPAALKQADQVMFGRRFAASNEFDDEKIFDFVIRALSNYTRHIGEMVQGGVVAEVVQPVFDLVRAFVVTVNEFNFARAVVFRLLQMAQIAGWSRSDRPLIELICQFDFIYKLLLNQMDPQGPKQSPLQAARKVRWGKKAKQSKLPFDQKVYSALVFQRTELLLSILQGASNYGFSTPYGEPDSAWAHYYPQVDIETGEETVAETFIQHELAQDGPWTTWPDGSHRTSVLSVHVDFFDTDHYDDYTSHVNSSYPMLNMVGRLRKMQRKVEEWTSEESFAQELDSVLLLTLGLDKPEKEESRYSADSDSDSDDKPSEEEVLEKAGTFMPLAVQAPAFMVQFAIENFIEMMLESNTNPELAAVLSEMDFTTKMPASIVEEPWVEVNSDNSQEVLGRPFPLASKMVKPQHNPHFGFFYSSHNPLSSVSVNSGSNSLSLCPEPEFQPSAVTRPQPSSKGLHSYSQDEQLSKLNAIAATLRQQLEKQL